jgi:hypothetical protein
MVGFASVNMRGVGLHSYGFMQKAFLWLVGFIISQLAHMCVASIPWNDGGVFARHRIVRIGPEILPIWNLFRRSWR